MSAAPKDKSWIGLLIAGLALAGLAYSPSFSGSWHLDDRPAIVLNEALQEGSLAGLWAQNKARFLTQVSLSLNAQVSGLETGSYHLVNVVIHLSTALFLGLFTALWLRHREQEPTWAWLAALAFAVHPLTTGAVTYLVQRAESLAVMNLWLMLWAYSRARLKQDPRFWGLAMAASVMALLSKETGAMGPVLLLALEGTLLRRHEPEQRPRSLSPFLVLLGLSLLVFVLSGRAQAAWASSAPWSRQQYLATQLCLLGRYFRLSVWPLGQSIEHVVEPVASVFELRLLFAGVVLVGLLAALWRLRDRHSHWLFAVLAGLLILAPSSSLVVLPDLFMEHRFYGPLGLLLAALALSLGGWSWAELGLRDRLAIGLLLLVLAALCFQRNQQWASEWTLWADARRKHPRSARVQVNFALALTAEGISTRVDADGRECFGRLREGRFVPCPELSQAPMPEARVERTLSAEQMAERCYLRALELDGRSSQARNNLGWIYVQRGRRAMERARSLQRAWQQATEGEPKAALRGQLEDAAAAFVEHFDRAEALFRQVIRDHPMNWIAYNNLGTLYFSYWARWDEADTCFREVLKIKADQANAWFLRGQIAQKKRQWATARRYYQTARRHLKSPQSPLKARVEAALKSLKQPASGG